MMTTQELSKATGIPVGTLKLWVTKGHLRPGVVAWGTGDRHVFDDNAIAQVRAILAIRKMFGDGEAARLVIEQAVPQVRTGTPRIRIPEVELAFLCALLVCL